MALCRRCPVVLTSTISPLSPEPGTPGYPLCGLHHTLLFWLCCDSHGHLVGWVGPQPGCLQWPAKTVMGALVSRHSWLRGPAIAAAHMMACRASLQCKSWGMLESGAGSPTTLGRSWFGGVPVLTGTTHQVWQGSICFEGISIPMKATCQLSCFGGVSAVTEGLGGTRLQGNTRVGRAVPAR